MLKPSTRATWKPKVTMSVAYTAADTSVWMPDTISTAIRFHGLVSSAGSAAIAATPGAVAGTGGAASAAITGSTCGNSKSAGCDNSATGAAGASCGGSDQASSGAGAMSCSLIELLTFTEYHVQNENPVRCVLYSAPLLRVRQVPSSFRDRGQNERPDSPSTEDVDDAYRSSTHTAARGRPVPRRDRSRAGDHERRAVAVLSGGRRRRDDRPQLGQVRWRSEEHTSELQSQFH